MSNHILCHHSQDEVWQIIYKLLSRIFSEGYLGIFEVNRQFYLIFLTLTLVFVISKCMWIVVTLTILLLNIRPGWFLCEVLRLNMISWACFVGSGLKLIFHCRAHLLMLERSLFNRLAESVILWTTEKSDVSSAKSLTFEFKPLGKSLMQIKKIVKYQELTLVVHPLWYLTMTNVDHLIQLSVLYSSTNLLLE